MQIQSNSGSVVIDYYPVKTWTNEYITDKFLRVLTFNGVTQTKRIVSSFNMGDDILNRVNNFSFVVTDNTKGLRQFVSSTEEN
tara:strand:+ start:267 stop:515 length:249 start_codon:yes stop_codon:yes gene_type:complete